MLTSKQIICSVFSGLVEGIIKGALTALSGIPSAIISTAVQTAEVIDYVSTDRNDALQHFGWWIDSATSENVTDELGITSRDDLKNAICENKYSSTEIAFDLLLDIAGFMGPAKLTKMFRGAGKDYPPPFPKGNGNHDEGLDWVGGRLGKGNGDGGKSKPDPTQPKSTQPEPTQPESTNKPSSTAPTSTPQDSKCKRDGGELHLQSSAEM